MPSALSSLLKVVNHLSTFLLYSGLVGTELRGPASDIRDSCQWIFPSMGTHVKPQYLMSQKTLH
jgi:hypothetical protein